ncbi:MAG: hypothetical protein LH649_10845 [Pseudanabaena sp. CAN_BIN31]|nr:hypothetical protein [Pseudanabaena sp. CAN_BIN31]
MNSEDEKPSVREPITDDIRNFSPTQSTINILDTIPSQGSDIEKTREKLANFLTYTLAGTIGFSFVIIVALTIMSGFFVDEKKTSSFDKTSALAKDLIVTILTSQIGLVGTVIGFYFGSKGNSD